MQVPHYWRQQKQRYALSGETCPRCEARIFPPRPVCPQCAGGAEESIEMTVLVEAQPAYESAAAR
jgi:uncharacterized OB-fold protein